ncbi:MAG: [FeFe] hydrogenase H-cluster maturation GTPase HydF [Ruminococcaceae bacterium]|nr:[FeFe] hydrogenase H-cluster maturation GTPase HydF [Oscillospiraceae bacterium]
MGLNETPSAERINIGFFGLRNAGKSSLVNRIANQDISLVSDVKGTTTDPVRKTMELLPLGPVVLIDTPGYDDEGELGTQRIEATKKVLATCDIAVLVTENADKLNGEENELIDIFKKRGIPYLVVHNKADIKNVNTTDDKILVSALNNTGIEELKERIASTVTVKTKSVRYVGDFVKSGDVVVLVTPIDASAPKGRLILPQQQAIRDILDSNAIALVTQTDELTETLNKLKNPPALVITDSQAFKKVMELVPREIPLTSFSILMARYKGFLDTAYEGAKKIDSLDDGSNVLICEGCTHHRQCEDIGTVKLPRWLKERTKKELKFDFTSGHGFPEDISKYDLIIHCGACMLNDNEVINRMNAARKSDIPITNYGTAIAYLNGILERSTEIIYSKKS